MKVETIKKISFYTACIGLCLILVGILYYVDFSQNKLQEPKSDDYKYVSKMFGSDDLPVVSADSSIIRPYTDSNVKIVRNFYNYKGSEKDQENSIINYEQTYIQNSGVTYGGVENGFEVISVLPGTVTSVREDKLLGTIVEIQNTDKVKTIYQGLEKVIVKENDKINQGDLIGNSGESNINKDLGKHVAFEIQINGTYVNPEEYYDKNVNEL